MLLVRHITLATNGLAENAVKTFKQAMKKTEGDLEVRLCRFLFDYRITPHATTGIPPCELLMNRRVKSRFDLLMPLVEDRVLRKRGSSQKPCNRQHPGISSNTRRSCLL